jgi:hypothetical protein
MTRTDVRIDVITTGVREMLLYEELARERRRVAEETARRQRLVRRAVAGRRWAWLARYAERRADLARRAV